MNQEQLDRGSKIRKAQAELKRVIEQITEVAKATDTTRRLKVVYGNSGETTIQIELIKQHGDKQLEDMVAYELETFLDRSSRLIESHIKKLEQEFEQL